MALTVQSELPATAHALCRVHWTDVLDYHGVPGKLSALGTEMRRLHRQDMADMRTTYSQVSEGMRNYGTTFARRIDDCRGSAKDMLKVCGHCPSQPCVTPLRLHLCGITCNTHQCCACFAIRILLCRGHGTRAQKRWSTGGSRF